MTGLRVYSLYSGSSGNSFLIKGFSGSILIDAGKSAKALCNALNACGCTPEEIRAIFLTHEHTDHTAALQVFLGKHPIPVHLIRGCEEKLQTVDKIAPCLRVHEEQFEVETAGMRVRSFPVSHDSRNAVGYRIEIALPDGNSFSLGFATDVGYVSPAVEDGLMGCRAVILESNHDLGMLKNGPYPYDLKKRIASRRGHLSNPDSAELASRLTMNGTQALMLAHLSRENNSPELAYDACFGAVGDESVCIRIAAPDCVTELPLEDIAL